jgi:uncharacterized membrane protein YkvA (DUF1232 family)
VGFLLVHDFMPMIGMLQDAVVVAAGSKKHT